MSNTDAHYMSQNNTARPSALDAYDPDTYRRRSMFAHNAHNASSIQSDSIRRALVFDSRWLLFSGDWCETEQDSMIAVGTYNEDSSNRIHILSVANDASGLASQFVNIADALVTLPQTKILWNPAGQTSGNQLQLISTGDSLRPWSLNIERGKLEALTPLSKKPKGAPEGSPPAPLTSSDWCAVDPNLIITSSIDTTCTLWDLQTQTIRTQLIAHDREVYDIAFLSQSPHKFVSVGADGSARLFDLRSLDSSTIVYENAGASPLLRVAANPSDPNILATTAQSSDDIYVIDIRASRNPLRVLKGHSGPVNSLKWAPSTVGRNILASAGDDCQILVWDMNQSDAGVIRGAYTDSGQVNNVLWCPNGKSLASMSDKTLQGIMCF